MRLWVRSLDSRDVVKFFIPRCFYKFQSLDLVLQTRGLLVNEITLHSLSCVRAAKGLAKSYVLHTRESLPL